MSLIFLIVTALILFALFEEAIYYYINKVIFDQERQQGRLGAWLQSIKGKWKTRGEVPEPSHEK